jgi:hypothetical protein
MAQPTLVHDDTSEALDIGQAGGTLATSGDAESTYRTNPGEIARDESLFTFAGTSEVFAQYLGARTRQISWSGSIRCSAVGLTAIRDAQDAFPGLSGTFTFTDDDGTQYVGCRIKSFTLGQKERIQDRGSIIWILPYQITLEQLEP